MTKSNVFQRFGVTDPSGIDRRSFLRGSAAALLVSSPGSGLGPGLFAQAANTPADSMNLFVSLDGHDENPGTLDRPFRTFPAAQAAVRLRRRSHTGAIAVYFRRGTYYLDRTVIFTAADSGEQQAPILYAAYPGERVVLSGGYALSPQWRPWRNGILQTSVPSGAATDQLFVNGKRQVLARYPNYDPAAKYLNGFSPDAISPERVRTWSDPAGGYIHALHQYLWGDMHYRITGKDAAGNLTLEGGWQNNRPRPMHEQYRYVENIFEELDAPGEWFLNEATHTLYFYRLCCKVWVLG
jgi:hypothetical protein